MRETYLRTFKSASRETIVAVSASLALHIGIVLLLTTATAMSTGLKLMGDPVLHVSLVSMPVVMESRISPGNKTIANVHRENRHHVIEPATAVVSIDKQVRNTLQVEQATSHGVESRSVSLLAMATGLGSKEMTKAAHDDTGRQTMVASHTLSSGPVSLAVPRYRDNAHPVYPWIARLKGYEGTVLLSVEIFADGNVGNLKIKRSSGYALLDRSALEAVRAWKFEPGRRMGRPIPMWVDVPVKFVLRDNEPVM